MLEYRLASCCRGQELFPTKFVEFLTSKPGEDEDKKKKALIAELQSVNDHLEKSGKPYFGGDDVCATDLSMAPKIKHIKIGADEVKVRFDCCSGQILSSGFDDVVSWSCSVYACRSCIWHASVLASLSLL